MQDAPEPQRGHWYHEFTIEADHDAKSHSDALIAKTTTSRITLHYPDTSCFPSLTHSEDFADAALRLS